MKIKLNIKHLYYKKHLLEIEDKNIFIRDIAVFPILFKTEKAGVVRILSDEKKLRSMYNCNFDIWGYHFMCNIWRKFAPFDEIPMETILIIIKNAMVVIGMDKWQPNVGWFKTLKEYFSDTNVTVI